MIFKLGVYAQTIKNCFLVMCFCECLWVCMCVCGIGRWSLNEIPFRAQSLIGLPFLFCFISFNRIFSILFHQLNKTFSTIYKFNTILVCIHCTFLSIALIFSHFPWIWFPHKMLGIGNNNLLWRWFSLFLYTHLFFLCVF